MVEHLNIGGFALQPSAMDRLSNLGPRRKSTVLYPGGIEVVPITVNKLGRPGELGNTITTGGKERVIDIDKISDEATPYNTAIHRFDESIDFSAVFGDDTERPADPNYRKLFGAGHDDPETNNKTEKKNGRAPEQLLTIFALRLALMEKGASGIGALAFLWATVVILGGFASSVSLEDFYVVTIIIVAEGVRIFSRSHELEWHSLSTKSTSSLSCRVLGSFKSTAADGSDLYSGTVGHKSNLWTIDKSGGAMLPSRSSEASPPPVSVGEMSTWKRTSSRMTLPMLPHVEKFVTAKVASQVLYVEQLVSAILCIGLSVWRVTVSSGESIKESLSLKVFYVLSVVEAGLFLLEKCYWEYKIRYKDILDKVRVEADLMDTNMELVRQFYYEVYSTCLKGSVFDGLDMDLVSFSIAWLQSEDFNQQLGGAKLLNRLVSTNDNKRRRGSFAPDALRRLGTTPAIIERLVEMLSWNATHERELVQEIATIICRLVVYNRNCSRIVALPGAMDGVLSLLLSRKSISGIDCYNFELWLTGLRIIKYLCKDHKNSLKIGETRGLLSILVMSIEVRDANTFKPKGTDEQALSYHKNRLKIFKKSLQVLGSLAAAANNGGGILRKRIVDIVSGLKNLRDVIEYGDNRPELQLLSVDILYHLAMEDYVRKIIGTTGGVIRNLLDLFAKVESFQDWATPANELPLAKKTRTERKLASERAGQVLARLVLQNKKNSMKMLSLKAKSCGTPFLQLMVDSLSKPAKIASCAAQILRSVIPFVDEKSQLEVAKGSSHVVFSNILRRGDASKSEMYEACLGLASRVLPRLDEAGYTEIISTVDKVDFERQLIKNLRHTATTNKHPSIRRYTVELILALIAKGDFYASQRTNHDLKGVLETTLDSISEVENFCLFSGLLGYARHEKEMETLVEEAIAAVDKDNK